MAETTQSPQNPETVIIDLDSIIESDQSDNRSSVSNTTNSDEFDSIEKDLSEINKQLSVTLREYSYRRNYLISKFNTVQESRLKWRHQAKQWEEKHKQQEAEYRATAEIWKKELHQLRRTKNKAMQEVKNLKRENRALYAQITEMNHLICDICGEKPKAKVTRCGHGYCAECFESWAKEWRENQRSSETSARVLCRCPTCRSYVSTEDCWPIYLAPGEEPDDIGLMAGDGANP